MFCSSLRKRKEWAMVPSNLLACKNPQWTEKKIGTHDLSIPLPQQARHQQSRDWFRILLVSSMDTLSPQPLMDRIERLCHQTGGQDAGIVFLLMQDSSGSRGVASFMELQARYVIGFLDLSTLDVDLESVVQDFDIPIFPLSNLSSLQATLLGLQRQLVQTRCAPLPAAANPLTTLLPFCSTSPPIPEHARNVLSDISHSLLELAGSATMPDGRESIRQWLADGGRNIAEDIIEFWGTEFIVDT